MEVIRVEQKDGLSRRRVLSRWYRKLEVSGINVLLLVLHPESSLSAWRWRNMKLGRTS